MVFLYCEAYHRSWDDFTFLEGCLFHLRKKLHIEKKYSHPLPPPPTPKMDNICKNDKQQS